MDGFSVRKAQMQQKREFDQTEKACGSREFDPPFPFPSGKAGAGGFPPRRLHRLPPQEELRPLVHPPRGSLNMSRDQ
jgi:hypothetical protein